MYGELSELLQRFESAVIWTRNPKEEDSVNKSKKLTATVAASAVASALVAPAAFAGTTFSDIDGSFAKDAILKLADAGILNGVGNGNFNPTGTIERQDFAIILAKALKLDTTSAPATATFTDVPKDHYAFAAVEAAVKAGLIKGTGNGQFGAGSNLTREDMAVIFGRALNLAAGKDVVTGGAANLTFSDAADIADYAKDAVGTAFKLGYISGSNGAFDPKGTATREQVASLTVRWQTAVDTVKVPVGAVSATVSATAANTITVKFNQPVDTTKATFSVKKATTSVQVDSATWSDDKTTATLVKSSGTFSEGDYTVTVSGLTDTAITNTVKFEAQKIAKIDIIGDDVIKAKDGLSASFAYKVYDQYNTDITKTASVQSYASNGGSVALTKSKGIGSVTGINFNADNAPAKVVVTLVDSASGLPFSKTLNVAAAAKIDKFTFGDVVLPENTDKLYLGDSAAGSIAVSALDQYGTAITSKTALDGALTILTSDSNVVAAFDNDGDGNAIITLDTSAVTTAENVVVTVVNKETGVSYSKTVKVENLSAPNALEFGDVSSDTIALGDTAYLKINVTDQFGNAMTADQVVKAGFAALKTTATGALSGQMTLVTDKNSSHYGQLKLTPAGATGKATIISTVGSTPVQTILDIKDARVLTEVNAASALYLTNGATSKLKPKFLDQYGTVIDAADLVDNGKIGYRVSVEKSSTDLAVGVSVNGHVVTPGASYIGTDEADLANIVVSGDAVKTGSAKVTVEFGTDLGTAKENVTSSATSTVSVVKNNVSGLTYSIAAIPTLNGNGDHSGTANAGDIYARDITVSAKDAQGHTYVIAPSDILSVTSSDSTVAKVSADSSKVYGANVTTNADGSDNTADKKATIKVKLNTLDGVKEVTTDVTVSPAAPSTSEFRIVNKSIATANSGTANIQDSVDDLGLANKSYYALSNADALAGVQLNVIRKDQYGVWSDYNTATIYVNSTNLAAANAFTIDATGKLQLTNATNFTYGKDITATVYVGSKSQTITINVAAAN
ncbi:hypothetical protein EL26_10005 [Tumebacillus flagellatus]|uniref:SLH domain-containing protein n=1 Tax=Tumebacillus flagellatus TaxID=1157490 RepID=A0A074LMF7_9BACL|nr:hypothetical protein EL26_10005 [Tumebacillus flagellatus]